MCECASVWLMSGGLSGEVLVGFGALRPKKYQCSINERGMLRILKGEKEKLSRCVKIYSFFFRLFFFLRPHLPPFLRCFVWILEEFFFVGTWSTVLARNLQGQDWRSSLVRKARKKVAGRVAKGQRRSCSILGTSPTA